MDNACTRPAAPSLCSCCIKQTPWLVQWPLSSPLRSPCPPLRPPTAHPPSPMRTCSLAGAQARCCSAPRAGRRFRRRWPAPQPPSQGVRSARRAAGPATPAPAGGACEFGSSCSAAATRLHAGTWQGCKALTGKRHAPPQPPSHSRRARPTCAAAASRRCCASSSRPSQALRLAGSSAGHDSMLPMSSKYCSRGGGGTAGASAAVPCAGQASSPATWPTHRSPCTPSR